MDEGGNTKDDLGLPKGTDDAEKLADQIKKDFDDGKELVVTVLKVGCPSCTHAVFFVVMYLLVAGCLCKPFCFGCKFMVKCDSFDISSAQSQAPKHVQM